MTDLAKQMWDAYAKQAGGVTFDGKPLPDWNGLGEDRQACWVAAARIAADRIETLEKALRFYVESCSNGFNIYSNLMGPSGDYGEIARAALEGKDAND